MEVLGEVQCWACRPHIIYLEVRASPEFIRLLISGSEEDNSVGGVLPQTAGRLRLFNMASILLQALIAGLGVCLPVAEQQLTDSNHLSSPWAGDSHTQHLSHDQSRDPKYLPSDEEHMLSSEEYYDYYEEYEQPVVEQHTAPKYMVELYEHFNADRYSHPMANTVRSFQNMNQGKPDYWHYMDNIRQGKPAYWHPTTNMKQGKPDYCVPWPTQGKVSLGCDAAGGLAVNR